MRRESIRPGPGVYFITGAGLVKIGLTTSSVSKRVISLRCASPVPLALHRFVPFREPRRLEKALHHQFADHRRHGEWFDAIVLEEIDGRSDRRIIVQADLSVQLGLSLRSTPWYVASLSDL